MAVKQIGIKVGGNVIKLSGLTTDVKPKVWGDSPIGNGSLYYEYDATTKALKSIYKLHDNEWYVL